MPELPARKTLASQTADILRREIHRGRWSEWLPSERALCEQYQVSRNTVRAALDYLKRDKLVRAVRGSGNRIVAQSASKRRLGSKQRDVALLAPEGLERLRPAQSVMIDELRALLGEHGVLLHVLHGAQYFRTNPAPALKKLVAQHPHACWLLLRSTAAVQQWFSERRESCIVIGSVHPGLDLPSRDLDHRAMCRHAAGTLLGMGHQRLVLMISSPPMAGDLESEGGIMEAVQSSDHPAKAAVAQHDGTLAGIARTLKRLMARRPAPTGLLVANAYHYLAVFSCLTEMGLRVPDDVSVISRDDDLFLSYMIPEPARYTASPQLYARLLLRALLEMFESGSVTKRELKLVPEFVRGKSIGIYRDRRTG